MYKKTRALVLRTADYKEADKILTVLTEAEGKLTVKAKAMKRRSSRISAACQLLTLSDMTIYGSSGRWYINEAFPIETFSELRGDLSALSLGAYFAEALEAVADEDRPNPAVLSLGLNSLFALSRGMYSQTHIKSVFELRLMCLAGFEPVLSGCAICGRERPEDAMLSLSGGVLHCRKCRREEMYVSLPVSETCLNAMRYIVCAQPKRIFSFSVDEKSERELGKICESYMRTQLERNFRTLDYYKSVRTV